MAKIHDKFVIELAEVIKGYGNNPDVDDPFRLSEFYRFYELPNIAVSRENFEKMKPLKGQWIPCRDRLPEGYGEYLVAWMPRDRQYRRKDNVCFYEIIEYEDGEWMNQIPQSEPMGGFDVLAWMELPEEYVDDFHEYMNPPEGDDNA